MGGDLSAAPEAVSAKFMVWALHDPDGANLDRIQVIKGWLDSSGKAREKIYGTAVSNGREIGADGRCRIPVGDTVDLSIPRWTNTIGAPELGTPRSAHPIPGRSTVTPRRPRRSVSEGSSPNNRRYSPANRPNSVKPISIAT